MKNKIENVGRRIVLLSALATIFSGLLLMVVAFWMPVTLLKQVDYTLDVSDGVDLPTLKQSCALLTQAVSASQVLATTCVRFAITISIGLVVVALLCSI